MTSPSPPPQVGEVTRLLQDIRSGREGTLDQLFPLVYNELRDIASACLSREYGHRTLFTGDLVHEAYLRLVGGKAPWVSRAHFLGIASRVMRQILVDRARRRNAEKRGGGQVEISLTDEADSRAEETADQILALDQALTALAQKDGRLAQVVELRFFGGLTVDETARMIGVSPRTVKSDWNLARAWLHRALGST